MRASPNAKITSDLKKNKFFLIFLKYKLENILFLFLFLFFALYLFLCFDSFCTTKPKEDVIKCRVFSCR